MVRRVDSFAESVRKDFPILGRRVREKPLVYLDSAASSQRPEAVIEAMDTYYRTYHSNIHRGAHTLGEEATAAYDGARAKVARFIGSPSVDQVVFTKNVTEALNLVAYAWGRGNLRQGDRILVSMMEHHANIVPWFIAAETTGAVVEWVPITDDGLLDLEALEVMLPGARVLACTAVSNVLGTVNPVGEICRMARHEGVLSVIDAAQFVPHMPTDVSSLGADFVGFTGHKMLGPTGVGALWGRPELLESMPPFLGGGEMIENVDLAGFTTARVPTKFEAWTMPIAEVVGLGAAVDYWDEIGMQRVREHDVAVDPQLRSGLVSFELGDVHPHDVSTILDQEGVAIRAGHHCAKPLHARYGVTASARASFQIYNTTAEIDCLIHALDVALELFGL
ncbi:MAG: aminotransferase class V-fold PLP-dependent enzyme [Actinobacteria bacterium ATB1]|nr:aminotransferase class V-fold PLP-dependent enzyme [Actinobacteria bacterium ATB1]